MRAIAIETSGRVGSIAAVQDGRVLDERQFPHGLKHAAEMIPMMDDLCRRQGWKPADLRQIYVSAGPGSFTGLRIGITAAKTLAFATGATIVAVPSVRVLAANAPADAQHLVIVLDAKRGQIFTAAFDRSGDDWTAREPAHLGTLADMLQRTPRPVHLIGEGIPYHKQFLPDDPGVHVTSEECWRARAAAVAQIGWQMAQAGQFTDPYALTPIYIRRPEAEEKALGLHP